MANYSQQVANAIAQMTKNVVNSSLVATTTVAERPRSVSDILDVRDSFVAGYPQRVEQTCRVIGE